MNLKANPYIKLVREHRNFRMVWFSQIISLFGDWFNLLASATLVAQLSDSTMAVSGIFLARLLPPFVLGPIAGIIADRFDRRMIMLISDVLRALVVVGFLFIDSPDEVWLLYLLTVLQLGMSAFFEPARAAILPTVVPRDQLVTANALGSITWSLMLALGAGLVTALFGIQAAFVLDVFTFLVSAWFVYQIRLPSEENGNTSDDKRKTSGWQMLLNGFQYLYDRPLILTLALLKAASGITYGAVDVLQVNFAEEVFPLTDPNSGLLATLYAALPFIIEDANAGTLGLLYFCIGLGTGLGPIIARRWTGDSLIPMYWGLLVGLVFSNIGFGLMAVAPTLEILLLGNCLRAVGSGINWVYSSALLQLVVPRHILGRVFAFDIAMVTLASAIATFIAGWLGDVYALSPASIVFCMMIASLAVTFGWWAHLQMPNLTAQRIEAEAVHQEE